MQAAIMGETEEEQQRGRQQEPRQTHVRQQVPPHQPVRHQVLQQLTDLQQVLQPQHVLRPVLRHQHVKPHLQQPDNQAVLAHQHVNQVQIILPNPSLRQRLQQEHHAPGAAEVQVIIVVEVAEAAAVIAAEVQEAAAAVAVAEDDNPVLFRKSLTHILL
jgi:hypothetical protein